MHICRWLAAPLLVTFQLTFDLATVNTLLLKVLKTGASSVSDDFFYAYSNGTSSTSAMNYKGRINSEFNLVNKGYVDNAVATAQPAGSYVKTPTADSSASVPIEIYRSGSSYYIKGGSS